MLIILKFQYKIGQNFKFIECLKTAGKCLLTILGNGLTFDSFLI